MMAINRRSLGVAVSSELDPYTSSTIFTLKKRLPGVCRASATTVSMRDVQSIFDLDFSFGKKTGTPDQAVSTGQAGFQTSTPSC